MTYYEVIIRIPKNHVYGTLVVYAYKMLFT